MGFVYTDSGEFVNAALILTIRRDSDLYAFPAEDGSPGAESAWDLTVKLIDGTEHRITAHRAAEAKQALELPVASLKRDEAERQEALATVQFPEGASDTDEELVVRALTVFVQERRASAPILQIRLGVSFAVASRTLQLLEMRGYVGPNQDGGREILVDLDAL